MGSRSADVLHARVLMRRIEIILLSIFAGMTLFQISLSPWLKPLVPGVRLTFDFVFINGVILAFAGCVAFKTNIWVGIFLAFAVFSAHYPESSRESRETLTYIFIGIVWYHILVHSIKNEKWWLHAICIVALIHIVFLVLQFFNIDFTDRKPLFEPIISGFSGDVPVGLMSSPHEVSSLLAVCFAAFFRKYWLVCTIFICFGLWQAHNFGGPLAIVVAGIFVIILFLSVPVPAKIVPIFILCVSLFLYAAIWDMPDITWRFRAWKIGLFDFYPLRPIFGFGLAGWPKLFTLKPLVSLFDGHAFYQAHNDPLQYLLQMGIPFVVCLTGFMSRVVRHWKIIGEICIFSIVAMFVNSLVIFPFHNPLIAGICIVWLALSERRIKLYLASA